MNLKLLVDASEEYNKQQSRECELEEQSRFYRSAMSVVHCIVLVDCPDGVEETESGCLAGKQSETIKVQRNWLDEQPT